MEGSNSITQVQQDFDKVYDAMEERLDKIGLIRTQEALKTVSGIPYIRLCVAFRSIMDVMVLQKKARRIHKGVWEILRPNSPQK